MAMVAGAVTLTCVPAARSMLQGVWQGGAIHLQSQAGRIALHHYPVEFVINGSEAQAVRDGILIHRNGLGRRLPGV